MQSTIKLNELDETLDTLDYPVTRERVIDELGDTMLQYADGDERLGNVVSRSTEENYEDPDELASEIRANLGSEALGEPGQSEGDG